MVQAQADRSADSLPLLDLERPIRLNFAGDWEKDFNRSDRWEDELNRLLTIRQERAAQQRSGVTVRNLPRASLGNLNLNSLGRRGPVLSILPNWLNTSVDRQLCISSRTGTRYASSAAEKRL